MKTVIMPLDLQRKLKRFRLNTEEENQDETNTETGTKICAACTTELVLKDYQDTTAKNVNVRFVCRILISLVIRAMRDFVPHKMYKMNKLFALLS